MGEQALNRYIQLTHLPTLDEIDHGKYEATVVKILAKAVALQLKPMNAEISKFAFEHLMLLVDDQLNDMIAQLHRFSNIQRRESIAKADLQLFLNGYNVTPSDLDVQRQASQYYGTNFRQEFTALHALRETYTDSVQDESNEAEEVINQLIRPTNPLINRIPKWMPAFPPEHTYKFTPQYNKPITDETVIRKRIVEEGKQSEVALLHLLNKMDPSTSSTNAERAPYDEELVREETRAIYGNEQKKRRKSAATSSDLLSKLPQNNFSVEEYARSRVELARKKVMEYEERQLELQRNPFIKYSLVARSTASDKPGRRHATKEIHSMLQRSLYHLINSIPVLQTAKQEARKDAEQQRDKRLQELREQKAEQLKLVTDQQLETGDINVLDLDDNNDDFFNYSGSEEEDLPQERQADQPLLPRLPDASAPENQTEPQVAPQTDIQTQMQPEETQAQSEEAGTKSEEFTQPETYIQRGEAPAEGESQPQQDAAPAPFQELQQESQEEDDDANGFLFDEITTGSHPDENEEDIQL